MKVAFRFAYLGDRYFGSQVQPGLRTVEGEFIGACRRLKLFDDWREAGFVTAGRTDRGVHARGQVCSFRTDSHERALHVLNRLLPADIWCTGWTQVPDRFHPRYDAASRTYRYYFSPAPADIPAMNEAARLFVGRHDFSSFARVGDRNPERSILDAGVTYEGQFGVFWVTAESFLWNMVRCMATALKRVGAGEADAGTIARLLSAPSEQRIPAAPPGGLVLWNVDCGIGFTDLPTDDKSRRYLADRQNEHLLKARIAFLLATGDGLPGCTCPSGGEPTGKSDQ
jgi:tRNA pseudouridine38-40 synthase